MGVKIHETFWWEVWDLKFTETQMGSAEAFLATHWKWEFQKIA